jgi:hypothetical protein
MRAGRGRSSYTEIKSKLLVGYLLQELPQLFLKYNNNKLAVLSLTLITYNDTMMKC